MVHIVSMPVFFLDWYLYVKNAIIAQPVLLIPISIAGYYACSYIYWAWRLGWWLAFTIVRARFLRCLGHTIRIIIDIFIVKVIFGGSLDFLFNYLGWVDLSPAHLHALLTVGTNVKSYGPLSSRCSLRSVTNSHSLLIPKSILSLCRTRLEKLTTL